MAATAALIQSPPLLAPSRVGRLFASVPVIDESDPHFGLGVVYERDVQVIGTATWGGNACETGGSDKEFTEINSSVTGIPFVVVQGAKCRMLNEWDSLGGRLGELFEVGEQRTVEEAFTAALVAGDYGTPTAGPSATDGSALATFAVAEQYIHDKMAYGVILASPEVITYAISKGVVKRDGDRLFTEFGTPVIELPGLDDSVYVTGQITIWRGPRSEPHSVQVVPYDNEFKVLTERVYTIAVEGEDSMDIVNWTVDLTLEWSEQ